MRVYFEGQNNEGWVLAGEDDSISEILLKEKDSYSAQEVAAATSFSFNRISRTLTYKSGYNTTYSMSKDGITKMNGSVVAGENGSLDLSKMEQGDYTFSVSAGEDAYEISIKL